MNPRGRTTNLFLFLFMLLGHHAVAQRHYVYLQSDDRRPFSVRYGQELLSSNATGYLIIPRLSDSNYVFRVSYPQGERPTAVFPIQVAHRDHGFQLTCNAQECALTDLQDGSRIKGVLEEVKKDAVRTDPSPGTGDQFTNSLALAIGDPQLTRTELIKQEPKPVVTPAETVVKAKPGPAPEEKTNVVTQAPKKESASKAKESAPPAQERAVSVKEESGLKMPAPQKVVPPVTAAVVGKTVSDNNSAPMPAAKKDSAVVVDMKQKDTLTLKMADTAVAKVAEKPVEKPQEKPVEKPAEQVAVNVPVPVEGDRPRLIREKRDAAGCTYVYGSGVQDADTVDVWIAAAVEEKAVPAEKLTEQAKADIAADLGTAPVVKKDSVVVVAEPVERKVRKDCKAMATAKDVDALKKRLAGIRDEDEKVSAALAAVKARCYDTEQVKALCGSFARNEGKYKLMDAVYPYVYDPSLYGQLEGLLTDPYFVHRLKVLTGAINR